MKICTTKDSVNGRHFGWGPILHATDTQKKQTIHPNPLISRHQAERPIWQLHQKAESTQARYCTRFASCFKTYNNPAGLSPPYLPFISACRHCQPCCPGHIVLQPCLNTAPGHCNVPRPAVWSHTQCTAHTQQLPRNPSWLITTCTRFRWNTSLAYNWYIAAGPLPSAQMPPWF